MSTTYALSGELYIATKAVAKTLLTKLANIVDTVLSDSRDRILLTRNIDGIVLFFDLRFDTEAQRNTIRDWLIERHTYAAKGVIQEHTCNDDEGAGCSDHTEVLKCGDWT